MRAKLIFGGYTRGSKVRICPQLAILWASQYKNKLELPKKWKMGKKLIPLLA
jgi:hypothetical protein